MPSEANADWVLATSHYGEDFVAAVCNGNAMATQFHPEKSGTTGLEILRGFLEPDSAEARAAAKAANFRQQAFVGGAPGTDVRGLARRVIACLDVRSNDNGDLVVTKGDQYDVREKEGDRDVRNLGKPVDLAARCVSSCACIVADRMHACLIYMAGLSFWDDLLLCVYGPQCDYGTRGCHLAVAE